MVKLPRWEWMVFVFFTLCTNMDPTFRAMFFFMFMFRCDVYLVGEVDGGIVFLYNFYQIWILV